MADIVATPPLELASKTSVVTRDSISALAEGGADRRWDADDHADGGGLHAS